MSAAREDDRWELVTRHVAPGVYFTSDGTLTADSLDSAIAYLSELEEPRVEGRSPKTQVRRRTG